MKILTLLILSLVISNATAGPFGYRPSFRPSFRPTPSSRPNYAPSPKPRVATPPKPAAAKPATTPTLKPLTPAKPDVAAAKSGNVPPNRFLGPVRPKPHQEPEPRGSSYRWGSGLTSPSPSSGGFGYYPYLWLLWQQTPQRTPLVYAPHSVAPSVTVAAKSAETTLDPEAEPVLTPKAESPAVSPESASAAKETGASSSRDSRPFWPFVVGIASIVALALILRRSQPGG